MSDIATPSQAAEELRENDDALWALAQIVKNNKDLRRIIAQAKPELRKAIYAGLLPHLRFKPLSFTLIKP